MTDKEFPDTLPFERWRSQENIYDLHLIMDYVIVREAKDPGIVDAPERFDFETLSDAYDWLEDEGAEYISAPLTDRR